MNAESLIGLMEYTNREIQEDENAEPVVPFKDEEHEKTFESLMDYTARNDELESGLITSQGNLVTDKQVNAFKQKVHSIFNREGRLAWQFFTSFPNFETAAQEGLETKDDYLHVLSNAFPKWLKKSKFKISNVVWWANVHLDTDNPHMHLVFTTDDPDIKRGKLKQSELDDFKFVFYNEVQRHLEKKMKLGREIDLAVFKEIDASRKQLKDQSKEQLNHLEDDQIQKLQQIMNQLPKEGRLQINSRQKSMTALRPLVFELVDDLLNHPNNQQDYLNFVNKLDGFDQLEKKFNPYKEGRFQTQELKKLRDQIANNILQELKLNREQIEEKLAQLPIITKDDRDKQFSVLDEYAKKTTIIQNKNNPIKGLGLMSHQITQPQDLKYLYDGDVNQYFSKLNSKQREVVDYLTLLKNNHIDFQLVHPDNSCVIFTCKEGVITQKDSGAFDVSMNDLVTYIKEHQCKDIELVDRNCVVIPKEYARIDNEKELSVRVDPQGRSTFKMASNQLIDSNHHYSLIELNESAVRCEKRGRYFMMTKEQLIKDYQDPFAWLSFDWANSLKQLDPEGIYKESLLKSHLAVKQGKKVTRLNAESFYDQTLFKASSQLTKNQLTTMRLRQLNSTLHFVRKAQSEAEYLEQKYLNQDLDEARG